MARLRDQPKARDDERRLDRARYFLRIVVGLHGPPIGPPMEPGLERDRVKREIADRIEAMSAREVRAEARKLTHGESIVLRALDGGFC